MDEASRLEMCNRTDACQGSQPSLSELRLARPRFLGIGAHSVHPALRCAGGLLRRVARASPDGSDSHAGRGRQAVHNAAAVLWHAAVRLSHNNSAEWVSGCHCTMRRPMAMSGGSYAQCVRSQPNYE
jgi:hypothetical protein